MMKAVGLILLFALLGKSSQAFLIGPLHASCKIDWDWPKNNCPQVQTMIVDQIKKWNTTECPKGEKCRYALKSRTDTQLTATHTTPVKFYVDDLTLNFAPKESGGCHVKGESRSEIWYAVLDYGTNYCNLENLITGSGLNKLAGYVEKTSSSICTQYSSANCEKY